MNITITINTDNDAFFDSPGHEVARILEKLAFYMKGTQAGRLLEPVEKPLKELNGNTVGKVLIEES